MQVSRVCAADAARRPEMYTEMPEQVAEQHGYGLSGVVGRHHVALGKTSWIVPDPAPDWVQRARRRASLDDSMVVFVAIDSMAVGS